MSPSLDTVIARLEGVRKNGNGYMARCLCHEDHDPSLHVWEEDGRVCAHCFAGCDHRAVRDALGLDADRGECDEWTPRGPAVAEYRYVDEQGRHLFTVCRTADKQFPCWTPDPSKTTGRAWKLGTVRRVLYRLPEVLRAVDAGETIHVAEGEKDADALRLAGAVATCNPHGAGKWRDEYSRVFVGAPVVVVADKDVPGRSHAEAVAASLRPHAASVAVVQAREGKDASDHLAAGYGLDDFAPVTDTADDDPPGEQDEAEPLVLEAAHADVLAHAWHGAYRWSQHEGAWRQWTGKVWRKASEAVVVNAAQKTLRARYGNELAQQQSPTADKRLRDLHRLTCRHASILGGLAFLKGEAGFHTDFEQWDADPYILNCADGILDLKTQTLRPHDPGELCTKITRWSFADVESSGAWDRHLRRCLPDDDIRRQVQRDLGRALVGTDLEESLPIWYGIGANGKSTTARTILQGVDEYGKQAVKDLLVATKFERHTTDLADLAGSRIVVAEEVEDGKRLDEATVKNLTGGNRKKARFMRGDNFEFEQTFSIFELVNHRPVIAGTDTGIWRRLRLVPWTESIPFADQRPQDEMVAELMADGPWMLRWMVAGLADWQADHHWIAGPVQAATDAYRAEQDILAGFLGRRCVLHPHATVSVDELHEAYMIDLMEFGDEGIERLSKVAFGKRLKSRNLTQGRDASRTRRMWVGIGLRTTPDKNSVSVP